MGVGQVLIKDKSDFFFEKSTQYFFFVSGVTLVQLKSDKCGHVPFESLSVRGPDLHAPDVIVVREERFDTGYAPISTRTS